MKGSLVMSRKSRIVHEMVKAVNARHRFGEDKHELKKEARRLSRETGERHTVKGVFSYGENSTDATYKKQARTFINWVTEMHPNVRTLEQTRKYVTEYLQDNIARNLSASTVHTRAYALACVFNCDVKEFCVDLPDRKSADNKRTRNAPQIHEFREETQYIHRFAAATGARRGGLQRLTTDCLKVDDNGRLLIHLQEKGGKERWARVLERDRDYVISVIEAAKERNELRRDHCKKVFPDRIIPTREPLHQHRREYARQLYDEVMHNQEHLIVDRGLYHCRGKRYGEVYDRTALAIVSYNLGHGQPDVEPHLIERVDVVVLNYMK